MRQKWEQDEEINRSKSSLHHQDVLFQGKHQYQGWYSELGLSFELDWENLI
jgi:hypothetical protein